MFKNILGDLKSTALGLALAVLQVVLNGRSGKQLVTAIGVAALGALTTFASKE